MFHPDVLLSKVLIAGAGYSPTTLLRSTPIPEVGS
jgi:hypothetical protein